MVGDAGNAPCQQPKERGNPSEKSVTDGETQTPQVSGGSRGSLDVPGLLGLCAQSRGLTWKLFFSPLLWLSSSRALWLSWGVCERGGLRRAAQHTGSEVCHGPWQLGTSQVCPRGWMGQCCQPGHQGQQSHHGHRSDPQPCPTLCTSTETTGTKQGLKWGLV